MNLLLVYEPYGNVREGETAWKLSRDIRRTVSFAFPAGKLALFHGIQVEAASTQMISTVAALRRNSSGSYFMELVFGRGSALLITSRISTPKQHLFSWVQ